VRSRYSSPRVIRIGIKSQKQANGGMYYEAEFTKKNGETRKYFIEVFPTGKPFSIEAFRNNQPAESKAWWSNGKQSLTATFYYFSPSGTWEFWNSHGETIGKVEFGIIGPRLILWDKEQMLAMARIDNFYADIINGRFQRSLLRGRAPERSQQFA